MALSWSDNSENEDGFRIEYGPGASAMDASIDLSSDVEAYTVTGLVSGTLYYFRICACNNAGDSGYSETISVRTDSARPSGSAPAAPDNLSAIPESSSSISLTWQDNSNNESGFRIYRSVYVNTGFAEISMTSANQSSYLDESLESATTYYYRIRAFNGFGVSDHVSASATTPAAVDEAAPSVPTGLNATAASSSQINLSWNASTDNVDVTGYRVYRGGSYLKQVSGTSTSDTGLSPGTTYTYRVSAVDAAGNESAQSASDSATTSALNYTFAGGTLAALRAVSPTLVFGTLTINGTLVIPESESTVTITASSVDINAGIDVDNTTYSSASGGIGYGGGAGGNITLNASSLLDISAATITVDEIGGDMNMLDYNAQMLDYETLTLIGTSKTNEEFDHVGMSGTWFINNVGSPDTYETGDDWIEDFFRFHLKTSRTVTLGISFNGLLCDYNLYLIDFAGGRYWVATSGSSSETLTTAETLSPGIYHIGVSRADTDSNGSLWASYTLTLTD